MARSFAPGEYAELDRAYPAVLFMPAPESASPRQLRMVAFTAADGDIVHLLDDTSVVSPAWLDSLAPPIVGPETPSVR